MFDHQSPLACERTFYVYSPQKTEAGLPRITRKQQKQEIQTGSVPLKTGFGLGFRLQNGQEARTEKKIQSMSRKEKGTAARAGGAVDADQLFDEYSMTAEELRRLKRPELLTIMLEQSMEIDRLRNELKETRKQLEDLQDNRQEQLTASVRNLRELVLELGRKIDGQ